jgi:plastocyanin
MMTQFPAQSNLGLRLRTVRAPSAVVRAIAIVALLVAALASAQSAVVPDDGSRDDGKMLRQTATTTIPTITVTTPADDPYAFEGMPASIKAGTYKIKYINNSNVPHNFKIRGSSTVGFQATPICSKCTKTITVTFRRFVNGVLSPSRLYVCEPHKTFMKGTVTITPAI